MNEVLERLKTRRLITWKDADQNLCTIAAFLLHEVSATIRTDATQEQDMPTQGGDPIQPGFADDENTGIGWWTRGWNAVNVMNPLEVYGFDSVNRPVTATCWYSFQNLVRIRLRQARRELEENLYSQNRRLSYEKNNQTRNPTGRRKWLSKFGRTKERP